MSIAPGEVLLALSFLAFYGLVAGLLAGLWKANWRASPWWRRAVVVLAVVFAAVYWLRTAWVTEDAYIIFRSLEQVMVGRGPVWNPNERVQGFTSPLWFLLLLLARRFSPDVYLNAILLHLPLAVALVLGWRRRTLPWGFGLVLLLATASASFLDFATSGLENSLGYLLLSLWVWWALERTADESPSLREVAVLSLLTGLIGLTRLDYGLLVAPGLLRVWGKYGRSRGPACLAAPVAWLVLPLLLWHGYALVFFGSVFPNTFYAKLNTGIPRFILLTQGFVYYYGTTFFLDPLLLLVPAWVAWQAWRSGGLSRSVALGLVLYGLYVGWIGGDFMVGRFFTPMYAVALAWLVTRPALRVLAPATVRRLPWSAAVLAVTLVHLFQPMRPLGSVYTVHFTPKVVSCGLANERNVYYQALGLLVYAKSRWDHRLFPRHPLAEAGRALAASSQAYQIASAVGMLGYYAGTEKIIIDQNALTDPFLARLPAESTRLRVGHYGRQVVQGYPESHVSGRPQLAAPQLNALLEHVFRATRGPLWSWERWQSIWFLESGRFRRLTAHLPWPYNPGPPLWHGAAPWTCARHLWLREAYTLWPTLGSP